ncbi:MAG: photosystem reaction center subunit H, partial [Salegentibacter sp.]
KGGVHEFINEEGEDHLIVPIGLVALDEDKKVVRTNEIDHQTFAETKRIEKGRTVDRGYEVMVLDSYNRDDEIDYPEDESLYDRREYDRSNYRKS